MCLKRWLIVLFCIVSQTVNAESLCQGKFINPITDICWSCLFPISIGDVNVAAGHQPDTRNPSLPICECPGNPLPRLGISIGYWEPIALVDVTRHPFCMVNLSGASLGINQTVGQGEVNNATASQTSSFYYVHWYVYPFLYLLNLLTDGVCVEQGDIDIPYLAELDPTWRDNELNFIFNPEAALFSDKIAQAACAVDAISATQSLPRDNLFWCAGAQGSMYPLGGWVQEHVGGVQASTLLAERVTYQLHRMGMLQDSSGKNGTALCFTHSTPILPKSRYRYQMVFPLAAASEPIGCKPFGHSTADWGAGHEFPYRGEDFGYVIWRKRNCCAY
jgi:conjugal transfer pilus assembly protein TraU